MVKEAMLASERLLEIEEKFEATAERIVPVELDEETLRVILYLKDGTNLTGFNNIKLLLLPTSLPSHRRKELWN